MNRLLKVFLSSFTIGLLMGFVFLVSVNARGNNGNQGQVTICHCETPDSDEPFQCQTLTIGIRAAERHLDEHEADYRGECEEITPTPTPEPEFHFACQENVCIEVEGEGENNCQTDEDCREEEPTPTPTLEPTPSPTPSQEPTGTSGGSSPQPWSPGSYSPMVI